MLRSKLILFIIVTSSIAMRSLAKEAVSADRVTLSSKIKTKNKISLDFEEELVKGVSDSPDVMFLNTRKLIKYNELYDLRTNFIQEIELNRELFNEL